MNGSSIIDDVVPQIPDGFIYEYTTTLRSSALSSLRRADIMLYFIVYASTALIGPSGDKSVCFGGATFPHSLHLRYSSFSIQCVIIGFNCVPRSVQWNDSF